MEINEITAKINSMTLDDFIENDPIAYDMYHLLVMIKQSPNAIFIDSPFERLFREARIETVIAYEDKHPEIDFDNKFVKALNNKGIYNYDAAIILAIVFSSLSLCNTLPKNLSLFRDCLYVQMQNYYGHSTSIYPSFENLIKEQSRLGRSYVVEDLIGVERPAEPTPATKDWKTLTDNYDKEAIKKCVLSPKLTPEERLNTLNAIEAQYNLDVVSDPCRGSKLAFTFFRDLKKVVSLDLPTSTTTEEKDTWWSRRLKKKINEQKEEITSLKRTIKDKEEEIKELNKTIGKANKDILSLRSKVDRMSEDNADRKDSTEAKSDDNGYRTRKVTTTVIRKLLSPRLAAKGKEHTMSDLAKVIGYLTNYSPEKIRQDLSETNLLTSAHKNEVVTVQKLFKNIGIDLELKIPE